MNMNAFKTAQRAYDNECPEDYEPDDDTEDEVVVSCPTPRCRQCPGYAECPV